jgi:ParB-like chromosome segregation protein Spo0J
LDTLTIERAPLTTLVPDPANARSHGPDNLASIVASLRRFGQAEPLIVQHGTNVVIAGNGRLAAMRELGWTECDVVFLDVDSMDATALGIALNRTADLAGWDDEILAKLLTRKRRLKPTCFAVEESPTMRAWDSDTSDEGWSVCCAGVIGRA